MRDLGCGIPLDNIQHIFEPFYTTKEQGKGTGLGLAAVYGTIQEHHGTISVYSEVGVGTSFHISLPCAEKDTDALEVDVKIVAGTGLILLVDDEEFIRIVGKHMLEEMGYKVMLAENGLEAFEIFQKHYAEIDVVVMDLIMPEMDGREAFEKIREIDENCKVIISSGFAKNENLKDLIEKGLAGFIRKPYRDFELSQIIAKALKA
jgi:CheY-like chemotaxis protein